MNFSEARSRYVDATSLVSQWLAYRFLDANSHRWPRDQTLWVFGALGGTAFADNAKYLFLHVAASEPDVRPVWLSADPEIVADLQSSGYEAYHCYSPRGIALTLRAGVVVLTQGHRDVAMPFTTGAFTVLLWHGAPLKHVSWDHEFPEQSRIVRAAHDALADAFDLLALPGPGFADAFASGLRIDRDRMAATGYPRNDALFAEIPGEAIATDRQALDRVRDLAAENALVAYLPTFRSHAESGPADHLDFEALDALLARHDAVLAVKPHPSADFDVTDRSLDRIVELPAATDPYPVLRESDALLTDYSSVLFDSLLLDLPLLFFAYDLDAYREFRGFYFDYDDVTPGPVARDVSELLDALDRTLDGLDAADSAVRDDEYALERRAVCDRLLGDVEQLRTAEGSWSAAVTRTIRQRREAWSR